MEERRCLQSNKIDNFDGSEEGGLKIVGERKSKNGCGELGKKWDGGE